MQPLSDTELFAIACCASDPSMKKAADGGIDWGGLLTSPVGLAALGGAGGLGLAALSDDEDEYVMGPDGRMVRKSGGKPWLRNALIGAGLGLGGGLLKNWLSGSTPAGGVGNLDDYLRDQRASIAAGRPASAKPKDIAYREAAKDAPVDGTSLDSYLRNVGVSATGRPASAKPNDIAYREAAKDAPVDAGRSPREQAANLQQSFASGGPVSAIPASVVARLAVKSKPAPTIPPSYQPGSAPGLARSNGGQLFDDSSDPFYGDKWLSNAQLAEHGARRWLLDTKPGLVKAEQLLAKFKGGVSPKVVEAVRNRRREFDALSGAMENWNTSQAELMGGAQAAQLEANRLGAAFDANKDTEAQITEALGKGFDRQKGFDELISGALTTPLDNRDAASRAADAEVEDAVSTYGR